MLPCSNMDCKNKVVSLHNTTAYVGVELQLHSFITLALDGMSGQLHITAALLSEKSCSTLCVGSWMGVSRCGRFGEGMNLFRSYKESNYDFLHVQPVAWSVYRLRCCTSPNLHRAINIPTEILCVSFQYLHEKERIIHWNRPRPLLSSPHILTIDP